MTAIELLRIMFDPENQPPQFIPEEAWDIIQTMEEE